MSLFAAGALLLAACGDATEPPPAQDDGGATDDEEAAPETDYPSERIDFIVPFGPGGTTDTVSRVFVEFLEDELDASITVINEEGGSATIGTNAIVGSDPDGHTLGMSTNSGLLFQPLVNDDVQYSPFDGYEAWVKMAAVPPVLTVAADAPWDTLEEFIEDARSRPGEIRVSTSGALTQTSKVIDLLNDEAEIDLRTVPYTGGGAEGMTAVLSGEVEANSSYGPTVLGQVEAGELKALGIVSAERDELFPDATPYPELGYNVTMGLDIYGIAPPGLTEAVLQRLTEAGQAVVNDPAYAERLQEIGAVATPLGVDELEGDLQEQADAYERIFPAIDVDE